MTLCKYCNKPLSQDKHKQNRRLYHFNCWRKKSKLFKKMYDHKIRKKSKVRKEFHCKVCHKIVLKPFQLPGGVWVRSIHKDKCWNIQQKRDSSKYREKAKERLRLIKEKANYKPPTTHNHFPEPIKEIEFSLLPTTYRKYYKPELLQMLN